MYEQIVPAASNKKGALKAPYGKAAADGGGLVLIPPAGTKRYNCRDYETEDGDVLGDQVKLIVSAGFPLKGGSGCS